MTIVLCAKCGKFYNGATLEKCPFCGSSETVQSNKIVRGLPTCHGGVNPD